MPQAPPTTTSLPSIHVPSTLTHHSIPLHQYLAQNPAHAHLVLGALIFSSSNNSQPKSPNGRDTDTNINANVNATPRILLLQRAPPDFPPNCWEPPGGSCEAHDTTLLHGVAREVREESGLTVTRIVSEVGPVNEWDDKGRRWVKLTFLVEVEEDTTSSRVQLDPVEHQAAVWASEDEVRLGETVVGGVITRLGFVSGTARETVLEGFRVRRALVAGGGGGYLK